jgi:hypothetical protein
MTVDLPLVEHIHHVVRLLDYECRQVFNIHCVVLFLEFELALPVL